MYFKRQIVISAAAAAASALAFTAFAEHATNPKTDRPNDTTEHLSQSRADFLNGAAKASDIIGMTVKNYQGEKLGKVEDLAVDVESGRIVQVILSTGGFIGIGDRLSAVPPGALHHDAAQKVLHLDANKEKLTSAPQFEMSKWSECCDSAHLSEVYRHYGQESALRFIHRGDVTLDSARNSTHLRDADRQARNLAAERTSDKQLTATGEHRPTDGTYNTPSTRNPDGTWKKDHSAIDGHSMIPASRLCQVQKASKLIGTLVNNLQDEKLGKVENILLDLPSGRIVAVIISSGGFLGIGNELSAVPPAALRFSTDSNTLQLDASKEVLSSAPHFQAHQWPDFNQASYSDGVYRAYNVEPYFTTNATANADNTARNVRDRDSRTLTPLDQGNSKADIAITAQIRKEIIADKNMSVNARNVKIITNEGKVTLRGPVNTAEEKRLIGEIAERIARVENVDNQIEVTLATTSSNN